MRNVRLFIELQQLDGEDFLGCFGLWCFISQVCEKVDGWYWILETQFNYCNACKLNRICQSVNLVMLITRSG